MRGDVGKALADASADDAQLLLSLLVWPDECPDPRVVDEWLRRRTTLKGGRDRAGVRGHPTPARADE
jgi:hypothetical protein